MNIKELAKKLDLSITTVSRALGGYSDVSEKTRERSKSDLSTSNSQNKIHFLNSPTRKNETFASYTLKNPRPKKETYKTKYFKKKLFLVTKKT